ncbi:MAG TPA: phage tail protein [Allosphingosinicella sp.]|nr:phage tail protein [Allosphingosinicella sp.]
MTCVPSDPRFRLLDRLVGWDPAADGWIDLADEPEGLRLAGSGPGLSPESVDPFIPPPPLAPGCGPCDWVLATPPAPQSRILVLGPCGNIWRPAWRAGCDPLSLDGVAAVAVDRHRLAIASADRIWILRLEGGQVVGEAASDRPSDIAFGPDGNLFAAVRDGGALHVFSASGLPLGRWPGPLPEGRVERMAFDRDGRLWLLVEHAGDRSLFAQPGPRSADFERQTVAALAQAFTRLALIRSDSRGFCLSRGSAEADSVELCFDWYGRPISESDVRRRHQASFALQGQLLTKALDSGIPRCRWHRLRIDAAIPDNGGLSIAVATSEVATPAPQGVARGHWHAFPAGVPHPDDWQELAPGITDALIEQPAGRYLFVRLRLWGDGTATPRVRRVHIDFPRTASTDLLPAIYQDDAAGGAFTERFVSLFDASLDTVAETVRRFPALLDSDRAPGDVLPWIASFLSVALDEGWSVEARRRILGGAAGLFRKRGTLPGLDQAIRLAYFPEPGDAEPAIVEHGAQRAWGGVAPSSGPAPPTAVRLGATRLFGRAGARFALGRSALGKTPVMSHGDPGEDPHLTGAFRFSVGVPPATGVTRTSLVRLIEGQKPAHTLAAVRIGGEAGFVLGDIVQLGIDTLLRGPAPMALGNPALRLRRGAVLAGRRRGGAVIGMSPLTSSSACGSEVR